jgi:hypothetical protein
MIMLSDVFANPVLGAGVPVQAASDRTLPDAVPPFAVPCAALTSEHSNVGPLVPLLSEHAWISVLATRRSPKTTKVHGRTFQGRRLARTGDRLASMVLAP